ncbi:MAG: DUF6444 domain-containing protein [Cetobacterium sp.]
MELRIKELEKENYELKLIIQLLRKEIEELKAKLNMNSSNSSFPPSSDKFKKKTKIGLLERKVKKNLVDNLGTKEVLFKKFKILILLLNFLTILVVTARMI